MVTSRLEVDPPIEGEPGQLVDTDLRAGTAIGVGDIEVGSFPSPSTFPGRPPRLHWRSLSDGVLVSFLIAGTTLFAGFVLHDQHERVWVVMLPIAAVGFLLGGAIAGRHRRTSRGAVSQGVACGLLTTTVIVMADAIRRAVLGHPVSYRTPDLWLGIEVGSVIVAVVGALIGRRLFIRSR
jgi:hypothetical protein